MLDFLMSSAQCVCLSLSPHRLYGINEQRTIPPHMVEKRQPVVFLERTKSQYEKCEEIECWRRTVENSTPLGKKYYTI